MLIMIMALQCDITEHAFPLLLNFISLNTNAAFLSYLRLLVILIFLVQNETLFLLCITFTI